MHASPPRPLTLLAVAVALLVGGTGVLRHPLDPIGSSPSTLFRLTYLLLLVPVIASMVLIAWRLTQHASSKSPPVAASDAGAGSM